MSNIARTSTSDGVCVLTFDRLGATENLFDRQSLEEFEAHLGAIDRQSTLRGVILTTAKPRSFMAGADLNAFAQNADERALHDMVNFGHRLFIRLGNLKIPSVAAIHGGCLSGGLEMALACDWRVASSDPATKLGLPETQLGLLPAWGGCTRLPKIIGLPRALELIVFGRPVSAARALKLGLIDDLTHPEYLFDRARALLSRGKRPRPPQRWVNRFPFARLVAAKVHRDVMRKTHGNYPAPLAALRVCTHAAGCTFEEGLAHEKHAFLELVRTPECRHLLSLHFLQDHAKHLSLPIATSTSGAPLSATAQSAQGPPVRRVAVVGAGTMGAGIAQWISERGIPVQLQDVNPAALARGLHAVGKVYRDSVQRGFLTRPEATAGMDRIMPVHTNVPLREVDLVIEAAVETLEVKQRVFREMEPRVNPDAVLATNTSGLSIDAIASGLVRPERLVGMHFFNPVHRMQLVEIVHGRRTSRATLNAALQFTKVIGKLPVLVKDSPGFLVNRILLPYIVEAVWMFTEGIHAATIDRLMLDFGMPMGPLRLADEIGLDVTHHVAKDLERRLPEAVPTDDTLEKMNAQGWFGKKSGRGFYVYEGAKELPAPESELAFLQADKPPMLDPAQMRDRLILIMINEAARVLEEQVVASPEDVDFGMMMGTGWAPFRGGPLRFADTVGATEIVRRLEKLARDVAPHFTPCNRLADLAEAGRGFYSRAISTNDDAAGFPEPLSPEPPGVRL